MYRQLKKFYQPPLAHDSVFGKRSGWEEARKGRHPTFHVLNRCDLSGQKFDFQLVDFSRVFTVDARLVRELVSRQRSRVRPNRRIANIWLRRSLVSS